MEYQRIKQILDDGMTNWEKQNGKADLTGHGPTFSWATKDDLLAATGHGKRLIQPEFINNDGEQTNLIIDLRRGINSPALRMPKGGPFIPDPQIQEISNWISGGCLD